LSSPFTTLKVLRPRHEQIEVEKQLGVSLGIQVRCDDGLSYQTLLITHVEKKGLIPQYNSHVSPEKQIKRADRIISVNGAGEHTAALKHALLNARDRIVIDLWLYPDINCPVQS